MSIVMYKPSTEGLINGNYLEPRRTDESPSFIRAAHRSVLFDDIDIQPTSEEPLRKSARLSKREKCMIAALILLAALCIVFIVMFAKASKGEKKTSSTPDNAPKEWITASSGKRVPILGAQYFMLRYRASYRNFRSHALESYRIFKRGAFKLV